MSLDEMGIEDVRQVFKEAGCHGIVLYIDSFLFDQKCGIETIAISVHLSSLLEDTEGTLQVENLSLTASVRFGGDGKTPLDDLATLAQNINRCGQETLQVLDRGFVKFVQNSAQNNPDFSNA